MGESPGVPRDGKLSADEIGSVSASAATEEENSLRGACHERSFCHAKEQIHHPADGPGRGAGRGLRGPGLLRPRPWQHEDHLRRPAGHPGGAALQPPGRGRGGRHRHAALSAAALRRLRHHAPLDPALYPLRSSGGLDRGPLRPGKELSPPGGHGPGRGGAHLSAQHPGHLCRQQDLRLLFLCLCLRQLLDPPGHLRGEDPALCRGAARPSGRPAAGGSSPPQDAAARPGHRPPRRPDAGGAGAGQRRHLPAAPGDAPGAAGQNRPQLSGAAGGSGPEPAERCPAAAGRAPLLPGESRRRRVAGLGARKLEAGPLRHLGAGPGGFRPGGPGGAGPGAGPLRGL